LTIIDTLSALMLEIDEAWLNHAEELAPRDQVTPAEVELENILFLMAESLEQTAQYNWRLAPNGTCSSSR
jgi:hypothetical protein